VKGAEGNIEFIFFMTKEPGVPAPGINFSDITDEAHSSLR
jgi:hypothetical protein